MVAEFPIFGYVSIFLSLLPVDSVIVRIKAVRLKDWVIITAGVLSLVHFSSLV